MPYRVRLISRPPARFLLATFLSPNYTMSITTTVGSLPQYIATATVPALTTFFTPPASFKCENRYVAGDTAGIAWSTYSRDGYAPPVDPTYYSCLPERIRGPHFSPGVCTRGQTIASITKYEAGSRTMWQAQCCKRYISPTPNFSLLAKQHTNTTQRPIPLPPHNPKLPDPNVRQRNLLPAARPRPLHNHVHKRRVLVLLRTGRKRPLHRVEHHDHDAGHGHCGPAVCRLGSNGLVALPARVCYVARAGDWRGLYARAEERQA